MKLRRFIRKAVAKAGGHAFLRRSSEAFWTNCKDNYLAASPIYYDEREKLLRALLRELPAPTTALDLGCGDGRFTLVIAEYSGAVDAFDLGPALIRQANLNAKNKSSSNVKFAVGDLESFELGSSYDLVCCMGVINASVVDAAKFARVLDRMRDATVPGGHLLLIDTLSEGVDRIVPTRHGYVANYRSRQNYVGEVEARGFVTCKDIVVAEWTAELTNKMMLFRRI